MRRLRTLLLTGILVVVHVGTTSAAQAQSDTAVAEAQARFKEGLDFADHGNHEAARLKFQQAWAVFKSPSVLFNLARAEQLTGHDLEALDHFRLFLRSGPDPKITDANRKSAQENAATLAQKVGQIELDVPRGARVALDGKVLEELPVEPMAIAPGRHVVEATQDGRVKSVAVEATAGTVAKAKIAFDGPATEAPPVSPTPPSSMRWIVPGAIGVVGLVGLGVGLGFATSSRSAKDKEDALRTPGACTPQTKSSCDALRSAQDDVDRKGTVATVGYIAGGALIAGAVITYLVWPKSHPSTASRFVVSPTARGGLVGYDASF